MHRKWAAALRAHGTETTDVTKIKDNRDHKGQKVKSGKTAESTRGNGRILNPCWDRKSTASLSLRSQPRRRVQPGNGHCENTAVRAERESVCALQGWTGTSRRGTRQRSLAQLVVRVRPITADKGWEPAKEQSESAGNGRAALLARLSDGKGLVLSALSIQSPTAAASCVGVSCWGPRAGYVGGR